VTPRALALVAAGLLAAAGCSGGGASPAPAAPAPRPDISGTWYNPLGSPNRLRPPDGEVPFTPWGAEQMKAARPTFTNDFRETTDPAVLYADPNGYPRIMMHPMKFKLVQTDDYVYQLFEYNQNWRQIAIDAAHSPDEPPTWYGNAVGKWDGDTLVVDTTGFKDVTWLDSRGLPHTDQLRLVERFRREGDALAVEITFEDPGAFTRPWTAHLTFDRAADGSMIENIYTISDELRFRERFLGVKSPIPIRR
jgi:hypothetical protein